MFGVVKIIHYCEVLDFLLDSLISYLKPHAEWVTPIFEKYCSFISKLLCKLSKSAFVDTSLFGIVHYVSWGK